MMSHHAVVRMNQRGYRPTDLDLVQEIATEVPDGLYVRQKDVDQKIRELEQEVERLRRLAGTYVVESSELIVAIYRPGATKSRRILRGRRERGLKS